MMIAEYLSAWIVLLDSVAFSNGNRFRLLVQLQERLDGLKGETSMELLCHGNTLLSKADSSPAPLGLQ